MSATRFQFIVLAFAAMSKLANADTIALPAHPPIAGGNAYLVDESPKPYEYQYGVSDDYSGARFAVKEAADGGAVRGSYVVHLPDGRIQTVNYIADHNNGYVADVKYEGTPVYPEQKPYKPSN